MARSKKTKVSIDTMFFVTPEQKLMRFLLTEPTTTFTPRVLSSKLKGVRGLGGVDGIKRILDELALLGMIHWVNNNQAVCLHNDNTFVQALKSLSALCDLEGIKEMLEPISTAGILFGSRANGRARSDSNYDIFIVSITPEEVRKIVTRHPLGKRIELHVTGPDDYARISKQDPILAQKLEEGVYMWGSSW
jgi:hypothetical protein